MKTFRAAVDITVYDDPIITADEVKEEIAHRLTGMQRYAMVADEVQVEET